MDRQELEEIILEYAAKKGMVLILQDILQRSGMEPFQVLFMTPLRLFLAVVLVIIEKDDVVDFRRAVRILKVVKLKFNKNNRRDLSLPRFTKIIIELKRRIVLHKMKRMETAEGTAALINRYFPNLKWECKITNRSTTITHDKLRLLEVRQQLLRICHIEKLRHYIVPISEKRELLNEVKHFVREVNDYLPPTKLEQLSLRVGDCHNELPSSLLGKGSPEKKMPFQKLVLLCRNGPPNESDLRDLLVEIWDGESPRKKRRQTKERANDGENNQEKQTTEEEVGGRLEGDILSGDRNHVLDYSEELASDVGTAEENLTENNDIHEGSQCDLVVRDIVAIDHNHNSPSSSNSLDDDLHISSHPRDQSQIPRLTLDLTTGQDNARKLPSKFDEFILQYDRRKDNLDDGVSDMLTPHNLLSVHYNRSVQSVELLNSKFQRPLPDANLSPELITGHSHAVRLSSENDGHPPVVCRKTLTQGDDQSPATKLSPELTTGHPHSVKLSSGNDKLGPQVHFEMHTRISDQSRETRHLPEVTAGHHHAETSSSGSWGHYLHVGQQGYNLGRGQSAVTSPSPELITSSNNTVTSSESHGSHQVCGQTPNRISGHSGVIRPSPDLVTGHSHAETSTQSSDRDGYNCSAYRETIDRSPDRSKLTGQSHDHGSCSNIPSIQSAQNELEMNKSREWPVCRSPNRSRLMRKSKAMSRNCHDDNTSYMYVKDGEKAMENDFSDSDVMLISNDQDHDDGEIRSPSSPEHGTPSSPSVEENYHLTTFQKCSVVLIDCMKGREKAKIEQACCKSKMEPLQMSCSHASTRLHPRQKGHDARNGRLSSNSRGGRSELLSFSKRVRSRQRESRSKMERSGQKHEYIRDWRGRFSSKKSLNPLIVRKKKPDGIINISTSPVSPDEVLSGRKIDGSRNRSVLRMLHDEALTTRKFCGNANRSDPPILGNEAFAERKINDTSPGSVPSMSPDGALTMQKIRGNAHGSDHPMLRNEALAVRKMNDTSHGSIQSMSPGEALAKQKICGNAHGSHRPMLRNKALAVRKMNDTSHGSVQSMSFGEALAKQKIFGNSHGSDLPMLRNEALAGRKINDSTRGSLHSTCMSPGEALAIVNIGEDAEEAVLASTPARISKELYEDARTELKQRSSRFHRRRLHHRIHGADFPPCSVYLQKYKECTVKHSKRLVIQKSSGSFRYKKQSFVRKSISTPEFGRVILHQDLPAFGLYI